MKKSDMEKKITTLLNNLERIKISNYLKAQAILVEVEALGMLAPITQKLVKTDIDHESVEVMNAWDRE